MTQATPSPESELRYAVFADWRRDKLLAAFQREGDARQYRHQHCPCGGVLVDLQAGREIDAVRASVQQP